MNEHRQKVLELFEHYLAVDICEIVVIVNNAPGVDVFGVTGENRSLKDVMDEVYTSTGMQVDAKK